MKTQNTNEIIQRGVRGGGREHTHTRKRRMLFAEQESGRPRDESLDFSNPWKMPAVKFERLSKPPQWTVWSNCAPRTKWKLCT